MTAYGTLLGDYHYDWMQRELVRPFYLTDNERLPQYATEAVLRAPVPPRCRPCEVLYGWRVETVDAGRGRRDASTIAERDGAGAAQHPRPTMPSAATAARPSCGTPAGITQTRCGPRPADGAARVPLRPGCTSCWSAIPASRSTACCTPELQGYWQFFGRVDLGTTWFFHAPVPRRHDARTTSISGALLHEAAGADVRRRVPAYRLLGPALRRGRHLSRRPPVHRRRRGAQPSALWRLRHQHRLRGRAQPRLEAGRASAGLGRGRACSTATPPSGSRCSPRRPATSSRSPSRTTACSSPPTTRPATARRSRRSGAERQSGAKSEVGAFEPNYEGSPVVAGPPGGRCSAVGAHRFAARAGHHLAPQPLSAGGTVTDALGAGFSLLAFDADPAAVSSFRHAADGMQVPLTVIEDSRAAGRERYEAALVLVRPDGFVAEGLERGRDRCGRGAVAGLRRTCDVIRTGRRLRLGRIWLLRLSFARRPPEVCRGSGAVR